MRYFLTLLFVGLAYCGTTVFGHIAGAWTAAASVHAEAPRQLFNELTQVVQDAWVLPLVVLGYVVLAGGYLLYIRAQAAALGMGLLAAVLFFVNFLCMFDSRRLGELTRDLAAVQMPAPVAPDLDVKGNWVGVRGESLFAGKFFVHPNGVSSGPATLRVAERRAEISLCSLALAAALALLPLPKSKTQSALESAPTEEKPANILRPRVTPVRRNCGANQT